MAKRDIVGALFPRPITLFKSINNSSLFYQDQKHFFSSVPVFASRMDLHSFIIGYVEVSPILYLEFGVWRGESFHKWVKEHVNPSSEFVGFDTFTGLPEVWTADHPAGTFSTKGRTPELTDSRGHFVTGLFQETLYDYLRSSAPAERIVIHVDCDLYSSTLFVLSAMDQFLLKGSVIVFDDFHSLNHEYAAWCDYKRAFPHTWKALAITTGCTQVAVELVER